MGGHFWDTGNALCTATWVVVTWGCLLTSPSLLDATYTPISRPQILHEILKCVRNYRTFFLILDCITILFAHWNVGGTEWPVFRPPSFSPKNWAVKEPQSFMPLRPVPPSLLAQRDAGRIRLGEFEKLEMEQPCVHGIYCGRDTPNTLFTSLFFQVEGNNVEQIGDDVS